jgi:bifunctional non-homologous end joining protein LigD
VSGQTITVSGREIELSNLEKVYFPRDGITKGQLIDYYRRIAETMLPYVKDRPITMHRFPDGIDAEGFYQKEAPDYFPDWVRRVSIEVEEEGTTQPQVVCNDAATLVYLAEEACITPHIWLSRVDQIRRPDRLILDLDPPDGDFEPVRFAAKSLRALLDELDLRSLVMTTGSRGLHVLVPLDRQSDFDEVRAFAKRVATVLEERAPERLTVEMSKKKRGDRLFLDYLRNSYAQHAVAPYAVRPRPGAPVATPLDWEELSDGDLNSQTYNIGNIFRRLGQKQDPWGGMADRVSSLKEASRLLDRLREKGS